MPLNKSMSWDTGEKKENIADKRVRADPCTFRYFAPEKRKPTIYL